MKRKIDFASDFTKPCQNKIRVKENGKIFETECGSGFFFFYKVADKKIEAVCVCCNNVVLFKPFKIPETILECKLAFESFVHPDQTEVGLSF